MWLIFGSWEPGWEPLKEAAAIAPVSVDGGTPGVGQWYWGRGGISEVSCMNRQGLVIGVQGR